MLHLKAAIVGISAAVIAFVLMPVAGFLFNVFRYTNEFIGFAPVSAAKSPMLWLTALVVFAAVYRWELYRLKKRSS